MRRKNYCLDCEIEIYSYGSRRCHSCAGRLRKHSQKTKLKFSKIHKGQIPWNKGKVGVYSEETRMKMSKNNWLRKFKELFGFAPNKGKKIWGNKAHPRGMFGKKHNEITKKKISRKGKKSPCYIHGRGYAPYSIEFIHIKPIIKQRDNYVCQECGEIEGLHIHHIDFDKNNNLSGNLITLCQSCHLCTNGPKNREKWIDYYKNKMVEVVA